VQTDARLDTMASIVDGFKPVNQSQDSANRDCRVYSDRLLSRFECRHWCRSRAGALPLKHSTSGTRLSRNLTLGITAKEYVWLWECRRGVGTNAIARREGVSVRRVRFGVARALSQENSDLAANSLLLPSLIPLFPVGPYTPHSSCGHYQPIPPGSRLCCMVCHCSGMDDHPALKRNLGREPIRECVPAVQRIVRETRRQRRRRLFG
jgi:hypothetical protein